MQEQEYEAPAAGSETTREFRRHRPSGLGLVFAAAAIALAACGSTGTSSPSVASLGAKANKHSGSTTTLPSGDATQLLNEWAACMRVHGDPNQAEPTIDADNVIHITWDPAIPGGYNGTNKGGQGNAGPGQYCRNFLDEAQSALGGGRTQHSPSQAQLVKVAECMRANGISDFPDPINGTLSFNIGAGGDLNPNNPTFQTASKLCSEKTGVTLPGAGGTPPPGTIELNGGGPQANPGGRVDG